MNRALVYNGKLEQQLSQTARKLDHNRVVFSSWTCHSYCDRNTTFLCSAETRSLFDFYGKNVVARCGRSNVLER